MSRVLSLPKIVERDFVQPVTSGGTGAMKKEDIAKNLALSVLSDVDQVGGPVGLDASGKIRSNKFVDQDGTNKVNIDGPAQVTIGTTNQYSITDFDSFRAYTIAASAGTVSMLNGIITLVVPSVVGNVTLTVNGRDTVIQVVTARPAQPSITSPVTGSANIAPNNVSATSSAFASVGGSFAHASSDWELATDPGFTNIVKSTLNDARNKVTWETNGLQASTTYYLRVRYKATGEIYSDYSVPVSFTTNTTNAINIEEALIGAVDAVDYIYAGTSVSLSVDGSRLMMGAPNGATGSVISGAVYIYSRENNRWTQEQKLQPPDPTENMNYGMLVAISRDGTRCVVGAPNANSGGVTGAGALYVYSRTGTIWTLEQRLQASDLAQNGRFGYSASLTSNGDRLIVGAPGATDAGNIGGGAAYIFTRGGTNWTQESRQAAIGPIPDGMFGYSVDIAGDGLIAVAGFPNASGGGGPGYMYAGAFYSFTRAGSTWTRQAKIVSVDGVENTKLGMSIAISSDGTRVVVGAPLHASPNATSGAAYVFTRSVNDWVDEYKLPSQADIAGSQFGGAVDISDDGLRVTVGVPYYQLPGTTRKIGGYQNFTRKNNLWILENIFYIDRSNLNVDPRYGVSVSLSGDGYRLAVGAPYTNTGTTNARGRAYIYR